MTSRKMILDSFDSWCDEEHITNLKHIYFDLVSKGEFDIEEHDYKIGKEVLSNHLSQDQKSMLDDLECTYAFNIPYAAKFGFIAGLFVGFHHYFVKREEWEHNIDSVLISNLFEKAGMERHTEYNERNLQCLELSSRFEQLLPKDLYEHVVSVDCAWGQRIYFSATRELYLGYRAAHMVVEAIIPFGTVKLFGDRLQLECDLGMIEDVDTAERRAEQTSKLEQEENGSTR